MTSLEVLDSALKIGLGALIAAMSTLVLTRVQHRNALRKETIEREFALLREVAEKTERFTHTALKYWSFAADWHRALRKDPATKKPRLLQSSQEELFNQFGDVTSGEALLLLLGHERAQESLRTYGDYVASFRRQANKISEPMSEIIIEDYRKHFLNARASLFRELHQIYKGLGP